MKTATLPHYCLLSTTLNEHLIIYLFLDKETENFVIIKGKETKVQQVKISVMFVNVFQSDP